MNSMSDSLKAAISSAKSGDKKSAYWEFVNVIKEDPKSKEAEIAWMWISTLVTDPDQKRKCLETVLSLNPHNEAAIRQLAKLGAFRHTKTERESIDIAQSVINNDPASPISPLNKDITSVSEVVHYAVLDKTKQHSQTLQIVGWIACMLLALGIFLPIVRLPIVGNVNYFRSGRGDGVLILFLAAASAFLIFRRRYRWLWISGSISLGILSFTFLALMGLILDLGKTLSEELRGNMFAGFAELLYESIQIEWGWLILFLGSGALLYVAVADAKRSKSVPWKHAITGAILYFIIFLGLWFFRESVFDTSSVSGGNKSEDRTKTIEKLDAIPVGDSIEYEEGELRVIQVHQPTGYYVIDTSGFESEGAPTIPGTDYVAVELEFTCRSESKVLCNSAPEADLGLLLSDGRQINDKDMGLLDAPNLGEKELATGRSQKGWKVFQVPENATIEALLVEPYLGELLKADLPTSINGYGQILPQRASGSTVGYVLPELRKRLVEMGYDPRAASRMDDEGDTNIWVHICKDVDFYFDEEEALSDHDGIMADVLSQVRGIRLFREAVILTIDDCSSYSISNIVIGLSGDDIEKWERGQITTNNLIKKAYVSLD